VIVKPCDICGEEYEARASNQKYCPECKDDARRARDRVAEIEKPGVE
jgi:uncharacterized Zn ribbon protein